MLRGFPKARRQEKWVTGRIWIGTLLSECRINLIKADVFGESILIELFQEMSIFLCFFSLYGEFQHFNRENIRSIRRQLNILINVLRISYYYIYYKRVKLWLLDQVLFIVYELKTQDNCNGTLFLCMIIYCFTLASLNGAVHMIKYDEIALKHHTNFISWEGNTNDESSISG